MRRELILIPKIPENKLPNKKHNHKFSLFNLENKYLLEYWK